MKKRKGISDKSFLIRTGAVIIGICVVFLLFGIVGYGYICKTHEVEKTVVQFVIQTDSAGHVVPEVERQVDSLVSVMEHQERLLKDKYEHILDQKEMFNDVITIGGMVLAVVLSLFGFFGYKSLNDIEDNVRDQVRSAADTSFKEQFKRFKKQTKGELERYVEDRTRELIDKKSAETKITQRQSIKDLVKTSIQSFKDKIDEHNNTIENINKSLSNLDEKYGVLNDKLLKLEDVNSKSAPQRRTIGCGVGYASDTEESQESKQGKK